MGHRINQPRKESGMAILIRLLIIAVILYLFAKTWESFRN